jgi:hypothetical protein
VIVIAIIFIILNIIGLISALVASSIPGVNINVDDDEIIALWDDALVTNAIFNGISLIFSICALVGAQNYNIYLVGSNIVWLLANYIAGIVIGIGAINEINDIIDDDEPEVRMMIPNFVINGIVMLLFMYPHVGFVSEVKSGIMSAETYPREEFSCCCVAQRRM